MYEFIGRMIALDANGMALVIIICALGALIMHATLPVPLMAFMGFPILVACSLAARVLLEGSNMVVALERGPGIALTTGIGMIVALSLLVLLARIMMLIHDFAGKQPRLLQPTDEQAP